MKYNKIIQKDDGVITITLEGKQSRQCCGISEVFNLSVSNKNIISEGREMYPKYGKETKITQEDSPFIFYQILEILRYTFLSTRTVIISFSDAVGDSWNGVSIGQHRLEGYSLADFAEWYGIEPLVKARSSKTENLLHTYTITKADLGDLTRTKHTSLTKDGLSYKEKDLRSEKGKKKAKEEYQRRIDQAQARFEQTLRRSARLRTSF